MTQSSKPSDRKTNQRQSATSAKPVQTRQKPSATPAKPQGIEQHDPDERVTDPRDQARAARIARQITKSYPIRMWCMWTHHQKHGWWTHVSAKEFSQVRFTWRDMDDLNKCLERCKDEERFDREVLAALDDIIEKRNALDVSVETACNLMRRKSRALFAEAQHG